MNEFFMLTRGRTGSTAILDELGTANIYSLHELFLDYSAGIQESELKSYYQLALPFDLWRACLLGKGSQGWNEIFVTSPKSMDVRERRIYSFIRNPDKALPFLLKNNWKISRKIEKFLIAQYLSSIEIMAAESKMGGLVFKVLSHHLVERKTLFNVLQEHGYSALLLVRKNVVRQVLSGVIAKSRGVYNKKITRLSIPLALLIWINSSIVFFGKKRVLMTIGLC